MARAKAKRKSVRKKREYSLVQGANGALFIINDKDKPRELNRTQTKIVTKLLDDFEDALSEILKKGTVFGGPGVHLVTPEVFPE